MTHSLTVHIHDPWNHPRLPSDTMDGEVLVRTITPILHVEDVPFEDALREALSEGRWVFRDNLIISPTGQIVTVSYKVSRHRDDFARFRAELGLRAAHTRLCEGDSLYMAQQTQAWVEWRLKQVGPEVLDSIWVKRRKNKMTAWWNRWRREEPKLEVLQRVWGRNRWWPLSSDDLAEIMTVCVGWPEWRLDDAPLRFVVLRR